MRSFAGHERRLLAAMLTKGVNTPVTTSMGRLFDGVAALIGLHQRVSFEGQAAMALEHCAAPGEGGAHVFDIVDGAGGAQATIDWAPTITGILYQICATVTTPPLSPHAFAEHARSRWALP